MEVSYFDIEAHEQSPCRSNQLDSASSLNTSVTPPPLHLPNDVSERILARVGSDLGRFASVCHKATQSIQNHGNLWRTAHQVMHENDISEPFSPDVLPPGLWRACVLRESGPKPM
mmetsp:Transcript_43074/g.71605  ORF Transcript_43074/g.71605 Transcript_43074/m.71605 type:complete len:115 (+) Transcript_43074:138-482(+)|eukprot:CAMPEP_0119333010 /NCGR_PEP_ID=MMETSP1333-20130426/84104_1 /TAXON_ID=418940 /ORGANISM="Scyphosphaera apsteinii, Strain RCC1455" /LENGTH=114 /DNA_ID=CAMNT_0007342951 /DNA_START=123 /DNA_END=467 /DNA_ORIENTATION=-